MSITRNLPFWVYSIAPWLLPYETHCTKCDWSALVPNRSRVIDEANEHHDWRAHSDNDPIGDTHG